MSMVMVGKKDRYRQYEFKSMNASMVYTFATLNYTLRWTILFFFEHVVENMKSLNSGKLTCYNIYVYCFVINVLVLLLNQQTGLYID